MRGGRTKCKGMVLIARLCSAHVSLFPFYPIHRRDAGLAHDASHRLGMNRSGAMKRNRNLANTAVSRPDIKIMASLDMIKTESVPTEKMLDIAERPIIDSARHGYTNVRSLKVCTCIGDGISFRFSLQSHKFSYSGSDF